MKDPTSQRWLRVVLQYDGKQYDSSNQDDFLGPDDFPLRLFNTVQNMYKNERPEMIARGAYIVVVSENDRPVDFVPTELTEAEARAHLGLDRS